MLDNIFMQELASLKKTLSSAQKLNTLELTDMCVYRKCIGYIGSKYLRTHLAKVDHSKDKKD